MPYGPWFYNPWMQSMVLTVGVVLIALLYWDNTTPRDPGAYA